MKNEKKKANQALLEVNNLRLAFTSDWGRREALDGVSFSIFSNEIVALVGESGSGKSVSALSIIGLLDANARVLEGQVLYQGQELLSLRTRALDQFRGSDIAMIFQDAMSSLNPSFTIGNQVVEAVRAHNRQISKQEAKQIAVSLLDKVGLENPESLMKAYPHTLSGGMRQRVMIAMALAGNPKILIADEATTALDASIQAQIMELLHKLKREEQMSIILITHDMGLVAQMADRVLVMYAGQIVEEARVETLFSAASHPYTKALMRAVPSIYSDKSQRLVSIEGQVPENYDQIQGCRFMSRCPYAVEACRKAQDLLCLEEENGPCSHKVRCHLARKDALELPIEQALEDASAKSEGGGLEDGRE